jgi:TetR/AcrR family transcriptional regulator, transcriptional repressor for nem operon
MTLIIFGVKLLLPPMKVTRQQAGENRARVLRLAARRFRERGFAGVGVADLMHEAGLTHGGFYKQFASKQDLIAQACALGLHENLEAYQQLGAKNGLDAIKAVAAEMLSAIHRDLPSEGCLMAALGGDVSRGDRATRREVTKGIKNILDCLHELIRANSKKKAREKAVAAYATVIGAMMLSRAVDDPKLSEEILQAARTSVLAAAR